MALKYTVEITIDRPRSRVVELFDNPDNLKHWMPGLQSFEPLTGKPGTVGSKAKLTFLMNNRKLEMVETITKRSLFNGTYEAKGVFNIVNNRFIDIDGKSTRYVSDQEFQMKGIMKLFAWIMPGVFKKQSMKYLIDFKTFVENQT
jgi:carbon monoxide dehydrogenase subunit G